MKTLALKNFRAVLDSSVIEHAHILITGDRISDIGVDERRFVDADEIIDLAGTTLFPGFIDIHIHGAVGVDTMEASADDLIRASQFLTTQGVTGWLPTLVPGPVDDYQRAVDAITEASQSRKGARILGVHYEGPFVNTAQCGALRREFFRSYSDTGDVDDLPILDQPEMKHMMTLAPEVNGGIGLTKELTSRGWIVSLGHTRADFEVLDDAFAAGARHMTHFMNAMSPMHHRSPGPIAWGLLHDDVGCDIIADGIHLDRQMLEVLLKLKTPERLTLISDAIIAAGMGDGEYQIWGETITVEGGRTRNAAGSIAGSVISMLEAVRMMRSIGASDAELVRMASTNPTGVLGIDDDYGSIEAGKKADLVALDQQGNVVLTIIEGVISYQS